MPDERQAAMDVRAGPVDGSERDELLEEPGPFRTEHVNAGQTAIAADHDEHVDATVHEIRAPRACGPRDS